MVGFASLNMFAGVSVCAVAAVWDESIPTFPLELEEKAQYFIGHTYKVLFLVHYIVLNGQC